MLTKPRMLDRRVVRDDVDHHADVAPVRVGEQCVEVLKRPELRVDVDIAGDVVAVVGSGRGEERGEPDRVDAEAAQVRQARADPGKIADAVPVAVGEAADIDLVADRVLPPGLRHERVLSSSSRVGIAERPSSARHESDAAVFAARKADGSVSPPARCTSSAPWNTSPAPSVLTRRSQGTAGSATTPSRLVATLPSAPRVTTTISAPASSAPCASPNCARSVASVGE